MVQQKKHVQVIAHGVTLTRWYVGESPDEVGTIADWESRIQQMAAEQPPDSFSGLDLNIFHMDSPELEARTKAKLWNLEDGDPHTAGYQVYSGAYVHKESQSPVRHRLDIGVFPAGWRPEDPPMVRPLTREAVINALKVFGHEAGHHHNGLCDNGQLIWLEVLRLFKEMAAALIQAGQASNIAELWAEVYKAFFGPLDGRGCFSDNKPYTPSHNPGLWLLVKHAVWLTRTLINTRFRSFAVWPGERVVWEELRQVFNWATWKYEDQSNGWWSIDVQGRRWRYGQHSSGAWLWLTP